VGILDEEVHLYLATGLFDEHADATRTSASRSSAGRWIAGGAPGHRQGLQVPDRAAGAAPPHARWVRPCRREERAVRGRTRGHGDCLRAAGPAKLRAPRPRLPRVPRVRARAVAQHPRGIPVRPAAARRLPPASGGGRTRRAPRAPRGLPLGARGRRRGPAPRGAQRRSSARPPACGRSTVTCAARP
jgi:hypothetical protein